MFLRVKLKVTSPTFPSESIFLFKHWQNRIKSGAFFIEVTLSSEVFGGKIDSSNGRLCLWFAE